MKKIFYTLPILFLFLFQIHIQAQTWSNLGDLTINSDIGSICSDPSGNIYASGYFTDGSDHNYVAKYNGTSWSELGGLNGLKANGPVYFICSDASGNIYAAGYFTNPSGKYYVAKYNGTAWSELGGVNSLNANGFIKNIYLDAGGNFYVAGAFKNASGKQYVAKYNGTTWSELGGLNGLSANNSIWSITSDSLGNIYTAGWFTNASGNYYVAEYNGTTWSELGGLNSLGANYWISSICSDASGNIYAGGEFTNGADIYSGNGYVAKYNGTTWSELGGTNSLNANGYTNSICRDVAGNIYAAGDFSNGSSESLGHDYVAKYDGTTWSELGGLNGLSANEVINVLCTDPSGNIYAAGDFTDAPVSTSGNSYVAKYGYAAGIDKIVTANSIHLFPNPATNQLTIHTTSFHNEGVTVSIMNVLGQTMQEEKTMWSNDIDINIKNLSAGIYFLEMKSEGGSVVKKFIKE